MLKDINRLTNLTTVLRAILHLNPTFINKKCVAYVLINIPSLTVFLLRLYTITYRVHCFTYQIFLRLVLKEDSKAFWKDRTIAHKQKCEDNEQ